MQFNYVVSLIEIHLYTKGSFDEVVFETNVYI